MINHYKTSSIFLLSSLFCTNLLFGMDLDLLRIREQRQGNEQMITMQTSDGRELNLPGMLTLETNDGTQYQIETEHCLLSLTIKNMLEHLGSEGSVIPLPGLTNEQVDSALELLRLIYQDRSLGQLRECLSKKGREVLISLLHINEYLDINDLRNSVLDEIANRLIEPGLMANFIEKPNFLQEMKLDILSDDILRALAQQIMEHSPVARSYLLRKCSIPCIKILPATASSVCFNRTGDKIICFSSAYHVIDILDDSGKLLKRIEGHTDCIRSANFNREEDKIVSASDDRTIRIWNVETGRSLQTLNGHTDAINTANFNPDGSLIASASNDSTIRIWDIETGRCIKVLNDHHGAIYSAVFNTTGDRLASASSDKIVRIWNTETWECVRILDHNCLVNSSLLNPNYCNILQTVNFNQAGDKLVSGAFGFAHIWDIETETCLHTFDLSGNICESATFHPNGDKVIVSITKLANEQAVGIKIFDIKTEKCLHEFPSYSFGFIQQLISRALPIKSLTEYGTKPIHSACFNEAGDKVIFIFGSSFPIGIVDLGSFNELDHFLQQEITVDQALLLACIHKAMTCNLPLDFGNHPHLIPHFESLPQSIQDILRQESMVILPVLNRVKSTAGSWMDYIWKR